MKDKLLGVILWFWGGVSWAGLVLPELTALDLQGRGHDLRVEDDGMLTVVIFLGHECPVSNTAIPALNRLAGEFDKGVRWLGVISDRTVSREAAGHHFDAFGIDFPVLFDASGHLAGAFSPTHVPEVFLFRSDRKLAYRGALNNAFTDLGRRRARVEKHYLQKALAALLEKKPVAEKYVQPVGCLFESLPAGKEGGPVTYTRDVAPILNNRCVRCHRKGQAAPFSLTSYEAAAKRGRQMLRVIEDGIMPPWMPKTGAQPHFAGDRSMPDYEKELLRQWVAGGRVRGNPADLPPVPTFPSDWELGEPDLILRMPEPFGIQADGPDVLQNFVIPVDIPADKLVRAIEFRPGNKRVVHHSVLFLDDKGQARRLDAATPEPGYGNFGGAGFLPSGALGGWSVGNTARELPGGRARYLKKGSDLVMQIHYHPTGKAEIDQSEVGLYFLDRPVEEVLAESGRLVSSFWISDYLLDIPAGESSYVSKATYTLPRDVTLVGVVPHMHLLGKEIVVTATPPEGETKTLINIPDWNYNWQDEFYYRKPFDLPTGTRIEVRALFDNSRKNPANPSLPPKRVTWGDGTLDEMMFCFFLFSAPTTADLIHTTLHNLGHDLEQPRLPSQ